MKRKEGTAKCRVRLTAARRSQAGLSGASSRRKRPVTWWRTTSRMAKPRKTSTQGKRSTRLFWGRLMRVLREQGP